jgi:predicted transcriptional regulator
MTINIRHLEKAGMIAREKRKDRAGDWTSNIYHLDGLVNKVKKLAPEFTNEREQRKLLRQTVETPKGKRRA